MKSFEYSPIVNIVRAEIVTGETQPRVLTFTTVDSAVPEPFVSEGEETELRVGNTIVAQECLEDIIKGYNITLRDCALTRDLLEVADGGSAVSAGNDAFAGYRSPTAGGESERVRFTLRLYTAEKDYGGSDTAVFRFTFPNCVGTPAKLTLENGSFATPEYVIRSRPLTQDSAMTIEMLDRLPLWCSDADELPATPVAGDCVVATAALACGDVTLAAGETAYYNGTAYVKIAALS